MLVGSFSGSQLRFPTRVRTQITNAAAAARP
jgi:hypothetical protein